LLLEEDGQIGGGYVAEEGHVVSITASLWVLYNLAMERTMPKQKREQLKREFRQVLTEFVGTFKGPISTADDQWTVKGFIDGFVIWESLCHFWFQNDNITSDSAFGIEATFWQNGHFREVAFLTPHLR
jgi:hypothetical protein